MCILSLCNDEGENEIVTLEKAASRARKIPAEAAVTVGRGSTWSRVVVVVAAINDG